MALKLSLGPLGEHDLPACFDRLLKLLQGNEEEQREESDGNFHQTPTPLPRQSRREEEPSLITVPIPLDEIHLETFVQAVLSRFEQIGLVPMPENPECELGDGTKITFQYEEGAVSGIHFDSETEIRVPRHLRDGAPYIGSLSISQWLIQLVPNPEFRLVLDGWATVPGPIKPELILLFLEQVFINLQKALAERDPDIQCIEVFRSNFSEQYEKILGLAKGDYEEQRFRLKLNKYIVEAFSENKERLKETGYLTIDVPADIAQILPQSYYMLGHVQNTKYMLDLPGTLIFWDHDFNVRGSREDGFEVSVAVMTEDLQQRIQARLDAPLTNPDALVCDGKVTPNGDFIDAHTYAFSNSGGRANNEDGYYVHTQEGLFAVADGMGGTFRGERAASIALETFGKCAGDHDLPIAHVLHASGKPIRKELGYGASAGTVFAGMRILDHHQDGAFVETCYVDDSVVLAVHPEHGLLLPVFLRPGSEPSLEISSTVRGPTEALQDLKVKAEQQRLYDPSGNVVVNPITVRGISYSPIITRREYPYGTIFVLLTDGLSKIVMFDEIVHIFTDEPDFQTACTNFSSLTKERLEGLIDGEEVLATIRTDHGEAKITIPAVTEPSAEPDNTTFLVHKLTG